jgi:hypothetical protein
MNSKGVASILIASIFLAIFTSVFVMYQAVGIPGYCKNAERAMLQEFLSSMKELSARQRNVIGSGEPSGVNLPTQFAYPSIPFFLTPPYASVSYSTYDISVTVRNIDSDEVNILGQHITLSGQAVMAVLTPVFTKPVIAYLELGILATDGAYVDGSPVSRGEIYLPFFSGTPTSQLSPASGGGRGVLIKASNPYQNITIEISGSKIPQHVWNAYSRATGYKVNYSQDNVVIEIPPGEYLLKSGIASFISGVSSARPYYLRTLTPVVQKSPAVVSVEALDEYFNPSRGDITLNFVSGSNNYNVKVPEQSGLKNINLPYTVTDSRLSAVVEVSGGVSVFKAGIFRTLGGPYEVAFAVSS